MQTALVQQKLKSTQPDLLLKPDLRGFQALDFFKIKDILEAADPIKEELKTALSARLNLR